MDACIKTGLDVVKICLVEETPLCEKQKICTAQDAINAISHELSLLDREMFCVLNLKTNGDLINFNIVSMGTLNISLVSSREVFKSSILSNANSIIAFHNHPSGNLEPSECDIAVTKKLYEAGQLLDIHLLDHIIVAGLTGNFYSFNDHDMLNFNHSIPYIT